MTISVDLSRERAAGYNTDTLASAKVLLVGAGALGQSLLSVLALSQVGELSIVDFDEFESSNAARSPFFPTDQECSQLGNHKAAVVAHKLRERVFWSNLPRIGYSCQHVQAIGDAAFRHAAAVVSAVDDDGARDYINTLCRRYKLPLVEGGFSGHQAHYAVFSNGALCDPCWRCGIDEVYRNVSFSCDASALRIRNAGFVPATQSVASVLGGLMAEAVIQVLHRNNEVFNRRVYLDTRAARTVVTELTLNPECQTPHECLEREPAFLKTPASAPARDLLSELAEQIANPSIELPAPFVVFAPCELCQKTLRIAKPQWAIRSQPRCKNDGGMWENQSENGLLILTLLDSWTTAALDTPSMTLGLVPGALFKVYDHEGNSTWAQLPEPDHVFATVN